MLWKALSYAVEEEEAARRMMKSSRLLTMGGVILHKVFGLLCCDYINVTHLKTRTNTHTVNDNGIIRSMPSF